MQRQAESRVWDLPVRLVHWLLVIGLIAQWYTGEEGHLKVHEIIGKSLLALVAFRLLWGVFGSTTARFSHFLRGPRAVGRHLRALLSPDYRAHAGHNPAGGWMVALLLPALVAQASMGLFAVDDIGLFHGPLSGFVSSATSEMLADWHHAWFEVILVLVGVHILAVLGYALIRRETLIRPMITGRKPVAATGLDFASPARAITLLLLSAALVWGGIALLQALL